MHLPRQTKPPISKSGLAFIQIHHATSFSDCITSHYLASDPLYRITVYHSLIRWCGFPSLTLPAHTRTHQSILCKWPRYIRYGLHSPQGHWVIVPFPKTPGPSFKDPSREPHFLMAMVKLHGMAHGRMVIPPSWLGVILMGSTMDPKDR